MDLTHWPYRPILVNQSHASTDGLGVVLCAFQLNSQTWLMSLIPVPLKLLRGPMVLVLGCFIMFPFLYFDVPATLKQNYPHLCAKKDADTLLLGR